MYFAYIQYNTMYTEDQLENSAKNTLKTQQFELHTKIIGSLIQIHLKSPPTHKQYHRYSTSISLQDLEVSLHDKFEDLKNLQMFLCDRNNINVDLATGVIQLIISISLLNGKAITTKLGEIKLKEDIFDSEKCLEHIFKSCQQVGSFNEISYKNVVRELANMMKVLFKKVENIQENLTYTDREAFYSFKSNSAKNLRLHSPSSQKPTKTQKSLHERLKENQQHEFNELPQKPSLNKSKIFCTKQQLQNFKKQLSYKMNTLAQKQEKQELQTSILDIKIQEIKRQLKSELQLAKKSIQNSKENTNVLNKGLGTYQNNFMMIRSVESQGVSPRSKEVSVDNNAMHSSPDEDVKLLRTQFEDFSEAVISKIENLGKANELLQDKLKRIVSELDIRLQQKILQDSIEQIRTKIVDVDSLYFQQFRLNGTQIEYKGQDSISTMLLGKIKLTQKNKYSIKIVKTLVSNIQIGIIDAEYKSRRDCWSVANFILYVGWNSTIYEGPNDMLHKEGNPIAEGDVVTFRANLETGLIEWLVGGEVRAKVVWEKLKDKSINWVPMIRFYDHGDVISWVTDKMLRA